MLKATFYLDDFSQAQIKRLALRDNKSQGAVVRDAILKLVGLEPNPEHTPVRARPGVGQFNSGDPSLASRTKTLVREAAASGSLRR